MLRILSGHVTCKPTMVIKIKNKLNLLCMFTVLLCTMYFRMSINNVVLLSGGKHVLFFPETTKQDRNTTVVFSFNLNHRALIDHNVLRCRIYAFYDKSISVCV